MFKLSLTKEQIAENIKELVLGKSRTAVHQDTGIPYRTLDSYMSGATEPKLMNSILIAKSVGTSVEHMALREDPGLQAGNSIKSDVAPYTTQKVVTTNFDGLLDKETNFNKLMTIVRSQISPQKLNLSDLQLSLVEGDDFGPLNKGDVIMIDPSSTTPVNGQRFVFEYMDNQLIRELELVPGKGWVLKAMNERGEDQLLDLDDEQGLKIVGRIVSSINFF